MANAITIPPAGTAGMNQGELKVRTFSSETGEKKRHRPDCDCARCTSEDDRPETDPSRALTMREVAELRWRFTTVEADLGIRSTFGAQLDNAYAQMPSDDEARRAKMVRALRTKLARGWQPSNQRQLDALEELMGIGTPGALYRGDGNYRISSMPGSDHAFDENYIHLRAPVRTPAADPYESDAVLFLVRRLREIDRRRRLIGSSHDRVLEAVYGNSTAGDDVQAFRKRFGDLVDVVIAIVNSQRVAGDPPARAIVRAKLTDDSFVRMMRHGASGYLRAACVAYAETRS